MFDRRKEDKWLYALAVWVPLAMNAILFGVNVYYVGKFAETNSQMEMVLGQLSRVFFRRAPNDAAAP